MHGQYGIDPAGGVASVYDGANRLTVTVPGVGAFAYVARRGPRRGEGGVLVCVAGTANG